MPAKKYLLEKEIEGSRNTVEEDQREKAIVGTSGYALPANQDFDGRDQAAATATEPQNFT